jgi:hypothetical protein
MPFRGHLGPFGRIEFIRTDRGDCPPLDQAVAAAMTAFRFDAALEKRRKDPDAVRV